MPQADILEHYGVKGMRWGVRRTQAELDAASADAARAQAVKSRVVKNRGRIESLSNEDLQVYITRVNLEQQYARLSAKPKSAGQKFIEGIAKEIFKKQFTATVNTYASQQIGTLMDQKKK